MENSGSNFSVVGIILTIIGLLIGWIAGVFRAAWGLSKFESRVLELERFHADYDEDNVADRLLLMDGMVKKLELLPELVQDMHKTVSAIDKIVFQERGGLNVITIPEHDKMQEHCQRMFKKDLDHITSMIEQVMKHTGAEELQKIQISIANIEMAMEMSGIMKRRGGGDYTPSR